MNKGIYVLELNSGKYYVGKSNNIKSRISQHSAGSDKCAVFIKSNGGVKRPTKPLTPREENHCNWEKNETIARMIQHGFNHVRGWEYTSNKDLSKFDYYAIRKELLGSTDRCRKCGNSGHMSNNCYAKPTEWLNELNKLVGDTTEKSTKDVFDSLLDSSSTKRAKSKTFTHTTTKMSV